MPLNPFKQNKKKYHVTVEDGAVSSDEEFRQSDNVSRGHQLDDDKIAMGMSEESTGMSWDQVDGMENLARIEKMNDPIAIENAHKTANMIKMEQKKSL